MRCWVDFRCGSKPLQRWDRFKNRVAEGTAGTQTVGQGTSVNGGGVVTEDTMGEDSNGILSERDPGTPMPGAWDKVDRERVCKQTSCGYERGTGADKSKPDCKGPRVSQ